MLLLVLVQREEVLLLLDHHHLFGREVFEGENETPIEVTLAV